MIPKSHKEFQKIFDAYILGIPYNGKIITDRDFDLIEQIATSRDNNLK